MILLNVPDSIRGIENQDYRKFLYLAASRASCYLVIQPAKQGGLNDELNKALKSKINGYATGRVWILSYSLAKSNIGNLELPGGRDICRSTLGELGMPVMRNGLVDYFPVVVNGKDVEFRLYYDNIDPAIKGRNVDDEARRCKRVNMVCHKGKLISILSFSKQKDFLNIKKFAFK